MSEQIKKGKKYKILSDAKNKVWDVLSFKTHGDDVFFDDNTTATNLKSKVNTLETKVNECFQSVSSGKAKVASAITGKGVKTDSDATFEVMAENISKIVGGGDSDTGRGNYSLAAYNSYTGSFVDGKYVDNFSIVDELFFTFNKNNYRLTCNKAGTYVLFSDGYWNSYYAYLYDSAGNLKFGGKINLKSSRYNTITLSVGDYIVFIMDADHTENTHHAQIGLYTKYTSGVTGTSSQSGKYSLGMIHDHKATDTFTNGNNLTTFTLLDDLIFTKNAEKLICKTSGNYVIFGDGYWCFYTARVYTAEGNLKENHEFNLSEKQFNEIYLKEGEYITFTQNGDLGTGHHAIIGVYAAFSIGVYAAFSYGGGGYVGEYLYYDTETKQVMAYNNTLGYHVPIRTLHSLPIERVYLFNHGDLCSYLTDGWKMEEIANSTFTTSPTLRWLATNADSIDGDNFSSFTTAKAIDITNYNELYIRGYCESDTADGANDSYQLYPIVYDSNGNAVAYNVSFAYNSENAEPVALDISNLTGEYYLGIRAKMNYRSAFVNMIEAWLE